MQIGAPFVAPNAIVTTRNPTTIFVGTSSSFIIEEKLYEVLKSELERASNVVAIVHFQPPYISQVTSKAYPKNMLTLSLDYLLVKKVVLGSMLLVLLMNWEFTLMIMILG